MKKTLLLKYFGYSVTSLISLSIGVALSATSFDILKKEIPIIFMLWFVSIMFFVYYYNIYDYEDFDSNIKNEAKAGVLIVVILGFIASFFIYYTMDGEINNLNLYGLILVYFIFYIVPIEVYKKKKSDKGTIELIRWKLVMPALISIGFSLFVGIRLNDVLLKGIDSLFISIKALETIAFCIFVSAYLAVFEAWKITYRIGKEGDDEKWEKYNNVTTYAAIISIVILPVLFIMSGYGWFFIVSISLIGLTALGLWLWKSRNIAIFKKFPWTPTKTIFGFLSLLTLVIDLCIFYLRPNDHKASLNLEEMKFIFIPFFIVIAPVGLQIMKTFFKSFKPKYLIERIYSKIQMLLVWDVCFLFIDLIILLFAKNQMKQNAYLSLLIHAVIVLFSLGALIFFSPDVTDNEKSINIQKKEKKSFNNLITKRSIIAILGIFRIFTSTIIAFVVFYPVYMHSGISIALQKSIPFMLISMFGFILNDYYDYKKDLINKPTRAIPSGSIKRVTIKRVIYILIPICILSIIYGANSLFEFILYIFAFGGVTLYNLILQKMAYLKTVITAIISSIPVFFTIIFCDLKSIYFLIGISVFLFITGRELLMDIIDIKGDSAFGMITLPMIISIRKTTIISISCQMFGFLCLIILSAFFARSIFYIIDILFFIAVAICYLFWFRENNKYKRIAIKLFWIPMIIGLMFLWI